jgi:hypothetical protein
MSGPDRSHAPCGFDWPPGWTPGPLYNPPRSVYPPYTSRRGILSSDCELERAAALVHALAGIELGVQDARASRWLARKDVATVATLVVLIRRARRG